MAIPSSLPRRTASAPLRRSWRTYSFRITLLYFALLGTSVLVVFGAIYWVTADFMEEFIHTAIKSEESFLLDAFKTGGIDSVAAAIKRRAGTPGQTPDYYLLEDPTGKPVAGNLDMMAPRQGWLELPIPPQLDPGETNSGDETDTLLGHAQILPNGWFLLIGKDTDSFTDFEDEIVDVAAWSLGGVLLIVILGGRAISVSMLKRLNAITETTGEIMRGNFAQRIALTGSDDEFDRLSAGLNEMLDRIQALMEGLRQVSNDIAHDLRTPLARLRQRLEGARDQAASADDFRTAVEQAIGETDDILETFGALLRIAQIEAGTRRADFRATNLSDLAHGIVETYAPVAEDQGHQLSAEIAPGIAVLGDRPLLVQMLANLVENAICHTPVGTTILLALAWHAGGAELCLSDNGPGIPEGERKKVFRRFYRLDASRTTPGNGLGLSLVAAVAELHRIAIMFEDAQPGLRVSLQFPDSVKR
jgi:signal transduction histidine kinase